MLPGNLLFSIPKQKDVFSMFQIAVYSAKELIVPTKQNQCVLQNKINKFPKFLLKLLLMTVSYGVPVSSEALGLHQMCDSYI